MSKTNTNTKWKILIPKKRSGVIITKPKKRGN